MASPSGSATAISPSSPADPSPPSSISPPPAVSLPPESQPNATADPPTSLSSPPPVSGSPPPAVTPTAAPIPSSPPPTSSPPPASPPPIISPPPPSEAPPPTSPPPVAPPPAYPSPVAPPPEASTAPPASYPPPPPSPTPSPPTIIPSPPVVSPPPPSKAPPPTPARPSPPTPAASSPPALPPPPSTVPPLSSPPPPALRTSSPPPVVPSPPPVASPPPTPAEPSTPAPSKPDPPTPPKHSPSPPAPPGSPPPPNSRPPSIIPSRSPPSKNGTQSSPPVSPPRKSPPVPPSSPSSPPQNPTPSGPPSPFPTINSSLPVVPIITPPPSGPNVSKSSNSTPGAVLPGDINSSGQEGIKTGTVVGIAVVVSFVVLGLAGLVLWSVKRQKKQAGGFDGGHVMHSLFNSSQISDSSNPRSATPLVKNSSGSHGFQHSTSDTGFGHSKPWFTYEELSEVTNGFSSQNLLGEGGFGCVYKGCLPDGRDVAVKQLKVDSGQGEREFRAEVEIISRVHHRHLVSLVGYCISENQRLLVYDYVPNNTLHYHLRAEGRPVMDWATRIKVALGAARGIAYLHEDCHPRIIHRDIKSSNILLDNNFEAQVSDFGLAKLAMDACTHVTTRVVGTFGYLAPEYASSGKLTSKSDIFSFGVVILELVTGRKPVDPSQPLGDESLVEWARPLMTRELETGEFEDLPDPRLEKNYNQSEMFRMIEVAAACVRHSAAMRPHMGQVVRALDCLGDSMELHNGVKPGQSELFNSAQSAEIRLFQRMAFGNQDYTTDFSQTSWSRRDV